MNVFLQNHNSTILQNTPCLQESSRENMADLVSGHESEPSFKLVVKCQKTDFLKTSGSRERPYAHACRVCVHPQASKGTTRFTGISREGAGTEGQEERTQGSSC